MDNLTPREKRIVGFLLQGLSNKEIAQKLFTSDKTVRTDLSRIYEKTGCSNRLKLALQLERSNFQTQSL
jgi:DNA-binding NarL/FixJ family response regulator